MDTTQARRLRAGTRVKYQPNPVSAALDAHSSYYNPPLPGVEGVVVALPVPGGRKTFLPGPGGGLLYVKWGSDPRTQFTYGVSALDVVRA